MSKWSAFLICCISHWSLLLLLKCTVGSAVYKSEDKTGRYARRGIYLALDPCDAAGTGFRVTENSAITAAVLSGHPDSSQFMFLFYINLLYPRGAQQCPTLFGGERLQEEVLVYLCVVQIDLVVGDVFCRERVGLFGLHCAILSQLKTRNPIQVFFILARKQSGVLKQRTFKTKFLSYSLHIWCLYLFNDAYKILCAERFMASLFRVQSIYLESDWVEFLLL